MEMKIKNEQVNTAPRVEQRWNIYGDMSWCIVSGTHVYGFSDTGKRTAEEILRQGINLSNYCETPTFCLTANPKAPSLEEVSQANKFVPQSFEEWWKMQSSDTIHADHTLKVIVEALVERIARATWNAAKGERK